jgi:hypothetical protein
MGEWRYSSTHSLTSAPGGEWSASRPVRFTARERAPGTHWIGGWVGPRAVLDAVMRKVPSPRRESNPKTLIVQPVRKSKLKTIITLSTLIYRLCRNGTQGLTNFLAVNTNIKARHWTRPWSTSSVYNQILSTYLPTIHFYIILPFHSQIKKWPFSKINSPPKFWMN